MNCSDFLQLVTPYLDGACQRGEPALLEAHIAGCAGCRAEFDKISRLVAAVRALPRLRCPTEVSSRIGSFVLSEAASFTARGKSPTGLPQPSHVGGGEQPGLFGGSSGAPERRKVRRAALVLANSRAVVAAAAALLIVYAVGIFSRGQDDTDRFKLSYVDRDKAVFDAITRASPKLFGQHMAKTESAAKKSVATDGAGAVALAAGATTSEAAGTPGPNAESGVVPPVAGQTDSPATSLELAKRSADSETELSMEEAARRAKEAHGTENAQDAAAGFVAAKGKALPAREIVIARKNLIVSCTDAQETLNILGSKLASKGFAPVQQDMKADATVEQARASRDSLPPGLLVSLPKAHLPKLVELLRSVSDGTIRVVDLPPRVVRLDAGSGRLGRMTDAPPGEGEAPAEPVPDGAAIPALSTEDIVEAIITILSK